MRVLGIDPGSTVTGYGILDDVGGLEIVASGVIQAGRGPLVARLAILLAETEALVDTHKPDVAAVEAVFHARNTKSALVLAQARGAILAGIGRAQLEVFEYPPRQVKQTITGFGGADKQQVRQLLKASLGKVPQELDASDALAVALCHMRFSGS